jgi:hypothetical protein
VTGVSEFSCCRSGVPFFLLFFLGEREWGGFFFLGECRCGAGAPFLWPPASVSASTSTYPPPIRSLCRASSHSTLDSLHRVFLLCFFFSFFWFLLPTSTHLRVVRACHIGGPGAVHVPSDDDCPSLLCARATGCFLFLRVGVGRVGVYFVSSFTPSLFGGARCLRR